MKTYTNIISKIFLLASFFLALTASAQAPNKMSYQAVVRNTAGVLVANTNVGIQISILQTTATGTAVYIERHTTPTNANGLATIEIGGGTFIAGNFTNINWANGPYFIKTETDPTGGTNFTISGTSQMLIVPYALFAANSSSSLNSWGIIGNTATATNFIGTTNDSNVIFKRNSVIAGSIGINNSSYGLNALTTNSGNENTAIGINSLSANTNGSENTALGINTLTSNTKGSGNTANGRLALRFNTTGSSNTALGRSTLLNNTTGINNTATGREALNSNTTGANNTANGTVSLVNNVTGNDNTAYGRSSLFNNNLGNENTAIGRDALSDTNASNNTAVGFGALSQVTNGSNNSGFGNNAEVAVAINNNQVRIGNTAVALASVQVAWTTTSDNRWKSNIQKSNLGLEFIKQLNPVFYTRKDVQDNEGKPVILETTTNPTTEYGFIAQELESTLNNFNAKDNGIISKDDAGMLGVRYNDLLAPMVKAIQEQQIIIEELKAKIILLENRK